MNLKIFFCDVDCLNKEIRQQEGFSYNVKGGSMLEVKIDESAGITTMTPDNALSEVDFEYATQRVDDYLKKHDKLKGIIINTRYFPGWESFGATLSHFRFVRNYHRHVSKVALVTDSAVGWLADRIVSHFVAAEVRRFTFNDLKDAQQWIAEE
ncbi:STAS/SEC14 domain-containing protein [Nitrosomonas aestuarii]|uniref:STAS/SEC14 domain-containing protein n=1 Tax=Nitrosomonas aestuarii TaxID=52441 RepID=UPI000D2FC2B0|nr:STAS/SEC14 domain-containing protein [Nitrosomonas aestuarii]PTN11667.1 SpoIIAA-like protein [Nitrosomonas aestuarii]